jgi:hypothetical protein
MIGRDGGLVWGHAHRCRGCKKLWLDDAAFCKESMSALCPACFEHAPADQFDSDDEMARA